MKYYTILLFAILSISFTMESKAQNSSSTTENEKTETWVVDDLTKKWENNMLYTISVLEAMPEESYDFIPAVEMRSFQGQAEHIVKNFKMLLGRTGYVGLPELENANKETILKSYKEIFIAITAHIAELSNASLMEETSMWYGKTSKYRIFNLLDNHLAHHRGQMIVYLRLKGITPPSYIGW